jgi:hypothetical protein
MIGGAIARTKTEVVLGDSRELDIVLIRGMISASECELIQQTYSFPGAVESNESDCFERGKRVWDVTKTKRCWKKLYRKAIEAVTRVDNEHWQQLVQARYPLSLELEYIVYKADKQDTPHNASKLPYLENTSAVNMVAMLSSAELYDGGQSCFEGTPARVVSLEQGDALFFRGEACKHWVSPVNSGRQASLQVKMSRTNKKAAKPKQANVFDVLSK